MHSPVRYAAFMGEQHERLSQARKAAGYETATAAADAMGLQPPTYLAHENGSRGFKLDSANRYAKFFRVPLEWLLFGANPPAGLAEPDAPALVGPGWGVQAPHYGASLTHAGLRTINRSIPVLGEVAAGVWEEAAAIDLANFDEQQLASQGVEFIPVDVLGYERARLFSLRVRGPSMNLIYPDGRYVVIAPAAEAGIRNGDIVVVRRNRAGLVETTLKELVVDEAGVVELWPRSTDERYQEPVRLNPRDQGQDRPVILGVVVADYGRRQRPDQPAVFAFEQDHAE